MTIFTITYNEEFMLPHFILFYRLRFPGCRIVVYDNMSTDRTVEIAKAAGCEVISYDTGGKLSDSKYLEIKNNCWKGVDDWVIIADCDEFFAVNQEDIISARLHGYNIIASIGYNMVNLHDSIHIDEIDHGIRAKSYDKLYCFHAPSFTDIRYDPGAHTCDPIPSHIGMKNKVAPFYIACYHYKYIHAQYMINRHAIYASRLSDENLAKGWGGHYLYSPEQIRAEFAEARKKAFKIL